jgi:hypothetical protein
VEKNFASSAQLFQALMQIEHQVPETRRVLENGVGPRILKNVKTF